MFNKKHGKSKTANNIFDLAIKGWPYIKAAFISRIEYDYQRQNEKILAIIVKPQEIKMKIFCNRKHFELQLASFDLAQGKEIQRHYHPEQKEKLTLPRR